MRNWAVQGTSTDYLGTFEGFRSLVSNMHTTVTKKRKGIYLYAAVIIA